MCSESARPCHQLNVHWLYIARYTNMSCISSISQPCKVCTEGRRFKHFGIFFGSFSKVFGLSFLGLDHLGLHHVKASKNRHSRSIKWTLNAHFYGFRCTKNMCHDGVKARKNKLFRAMKCLLSIYFYRPWHHHNTIFANWWSISYRLIFSEKYQFFYHVWVYTCEVIIMKRHCLMKSFHSTFTFCYDSCRFYMYYFVDYFVIIFVMCGGKYCPRVWTSGKKFEPFFWFPGDIIFQIR